MEQPPLALHRVEHPGRAQGASRAPVARPYHVDAPRSLSQLDFEPQSMVGWLQPGELARIAVKAAVSAAFGTYADKREVESVLAPGEWHDYSRAHAASDDGLWIDYVADLGDGWDATYTVARLLAEPELSFDAGDRIVTTRRGDILVMGGDQVYPTASREEYNNRLVQPYRCALPYVPDAEQAPHLYAIPGNHDWYDGLNHFFKLFCQESSSWMGGWRTLQRRSYFALKLGERLWLWGIDIQLSGDIDQPQLDYFGHVAGDSSVMPPGSQVILCTAEPSWIHVESQTREEPAARKERARARRFGNLGYFERTCIRERGHELLASLAGDVHNYVRYAAPASGRQRIVCGGGGAYLSPTHNMPQEITLPREHGGEKYLRAGDVFPDARTSRKLVNRSWLLALFPHNLLFTGVLGALYLLLAWLTQSASRALHAPEPTLFERLRDGPDLLALLRVVVHSPSSALLMLAIVCGLIAFSAYRRNWRKLLHGGAHGVAHLTLFFMLTSLFAYVDLRLLDLSVNGPWHVLMFSAQMLVFGSLAGGTLFGAYLWVSNRLLRIHDNESLIWQSNADYKSFLRMHVSRDGKVTLHAIGVARVNRKHSFALDPIRRRLAAWRLQPEARGGKPWFEPREGDIRDLARLIEEPIPLALSTARFERAGPAESRDAKGGQPA